MSTLEDAIDRELVCDEACQAAGKRQVSFTRYLAYLATIPIILYLATFPLMMTRRLPHLGFSKFGPVLDYSFNIERLNADVVVFGDSSAFIGVDPRIVNAETGLRSVVLPNTVGSLPTTGDMALRRYLQHNRKPRLLILYFSPWSLNYNDPKWIGLDFEGEEELLRNGSLTDIARFAVRHPFEFLEAPFRALITLSFHGAVEYLRHPDRLGQTAAALGHMDYTLPYPALSRPCRVSSAYLKRVNDDSVRQLLHKYQDMGLQTMVYLAPIPDCAGADAVAKRSYVDLRAIGPAVEPATWFADDTYMAHIRPAEVAKSSKLFAEALRSWTGQVPLDESGNLALHTSADQRKEQKKA